MQTPALQVVADHLLTFRMMPSPAPRWTIEIKALASEDARREIPVGHIPLP